MYREEIGPREWMPGPKEWTTFEINTEGVAFLDRKKVGRMQNPNFRKNREMRQLIDLWTELNEIHYRSPMSDPTFPVMAYLHKGNPGYAEIQVKWSSEEIWPDVVELIHKLMDHYLVNARNPFMWVAVRSVAEYRKAVARILELSKKLGLTQYLPSYAAEMKEIAEWIARTLFVTAWADRQEERKITYPGQNLFDVAPKTTKAAREAAWELLLKLQEANKTTMFEAYDQALQRSNRENTAKNREEFGYLLAMEALGHGVGLEDHFRGHGLEVPDIEFHL
jgi:hypothetical protein